VQKGIDRQHRHAAEGIIPSLRRSLQMGYPGKGMMAVQSAGEV